MPDGPFESIVTATLEVIAKAVKAGNYSAGRLNQALRTMRRIPDYYHMDILCAIFDTADPRDEKSE